MNSLTSASSGLPQELTWLSDDLRGSAEASPSELLSRIERTMSAPPVHMQSSRSWSTPHGYRWLLRSAALLAIGFSAWVWWPADIARLSSVPIAAEPSAPSGFDRARESQWTRLLEPWPRQALAQSGLGMPIPAELVLSRAPRLREGEWRYERIRQAFAKAAERTEWLVKVNRTRSGRSEFWHTQRIGPMNVPDVEKDVDLIVVLNDSLAPSHRTMSIGSNLRQMNFSAHAVLITEHLKPLLYGVAGKNTRPRVIHSLPFDRSRLTAVNEDHLAILLAHAPLEIGWTGRVPVPSAIGPVIGRYSTIDMHMRVTALDTLTIADQPRSAWRVELLTGTTPDRWWIDTRTGELLRTVVVRNGVTDDTRLISSTH